MILLVDVGNTRIKWVLWNQGTVIRRGNLLHKVMDRSSLGKRLWADLERPSQVIIANVAGAEMAESLDAWISQAWSLKARFLVSEATGFGIRNAYGIPKQLGVDRWVAMIGARSLVSQACCVVDCGTAITVDGLSADGHHLGGVIFPGVRLMRESLYRDTRQILAEEGGETAVFGQSTRDCVWNGTLFAVAAGIDRVTRQMTRALDGQVIHLLTGGDAETLLPHLEEDYLLEPDLIFRGLLAIAGQVGSDYKSETDLAFS